jgi:hypothetical protein
MNRLPVPTSRAIFLTCLLALGGYGLYRGMNKSAPEDDTVLPEAVVEESTASSPPAPLQQAPLPISTEPAKRAERLALRVRVGDRFPLVKSVRQFLRQPAPDGGTTTNQSSLELVMSVSVEEVRSTPRPDSKTGVVRMAVRYHRVKFSQDLPGQEVDYDSDRARGRIPLDAQAYHGLKDNGFQFWLAANNQIVETVGFDTFLDRCLNGVAPQHRDHVRAIVQSTSGTDGVANFIDQSIGALPADRVREGESWSTQKKYLQPVPMWIRNQYTLQRLGAETAEVEILGSVERIANFLDRDALGAPVEGFENPNQRAQQVAVEIQSGHTAGRYVIDRQTGLPRESRVEQKLAMMVHLPGGQSFPQEKTTVTTIGYFTPERRGAVTIGEIEPAEGAIQQATAIELPAER